MIAVAAILTAATILCACNTLKPLEPTEAQSQPVNPRAAPALQDGDRRGGEVRPDDQTGKLACLPPPAMVAE
jgi:hypothetical protein